VLESKGMIVAMDSGLRLRLEDGLYSAQATDLRHQVRHGLMNLSTTWFDTRW
jgi:hypothetical protein